MRAQSLQRILFLAEGQLGDLLLLTPALRAVKESLPHTFTSVLVVDRRAPTIAKRNRFKDLAASPDERKSSVLSTNRHVDELLILNREHLRSLHGTERIAAELAVVRSLRRKRFDAVICTFPEDRFALWAFAIGAKIRIGQRRQSFNRLLTHAPDIEKADRGVLAYYCSLVEQLGATANSDVTEYQIPATSIQWAEDYLRLHNIQSERPLVAIHPGASSDPRVWPPERFAAVIDHLTNVQHATVVLLGGNRDRHVLDAIKKSLRVPVIEISELSNIGHLAAILRRCSLCISNDSGPRHLSVAVGTPSIALFRQHEIILKEWSVYCEGSSVAVLKSQSKCTACSSGCTDQTPEGEQFGTHCLRLITVDEVIQKAVSMLPVLL